MGPPCVCRGSGEHAERRGQQASRPEKSCRLALWSAAEVPVLTQRTSKSILKKSFIAVLANSLVILHKEQNKRRHMIFFNGQVLG